MYYLNKIIIISLLIFISSCTRTMWETKDDKIRHQFKTQKLQCLNYAYPTKTSGSFINGMPPPPSYYQDAKKHLMGKTGGDGFEACMYYKGWKKSKMSEQDKKLQEYVKNNK